MLEDHAYNLVKQLVQESKSLRRIKNNYKNDAKGCPDCSSFWVKMEEDKEKHVKELTPPLLKSTSLSEPKASSIIQ